MKKLYLLVFVNVIIVASCFGMDYHKQANGQADNDNSEIGSGIQAHYEPDNIALIPFFLSSPPEMIQEFRSISTRKPIKTVKIPNLGEFEQILELRHLQLHGSTPPLTTALLSIIAFYEASSQKQFSIDELPKSMDTFFDNYWDSYEKQASFDYSSPTLNKLNKKFKSREKKEYYDEIKNHKQDIYQVLFRDCHEILAQIPEYVALSEQSEQ